MRKMAKLNVAIADDNERILTMLDEVQQMMILQ